MGSLSLNKRHKNGASYKKKTITQIVSKSGSQNRIFFIVMLLWPIPS